MRLLPVILLLLSTGKVLAGFIPSVRVDHENRPSHGCYHADITVGPAASRPQPVYVAIEDDSFAGIVAVRSDVLFQKSTDAGRTWLAQDVLVKRGSLFACYPDITTDRNGNIYIAYTERVSGNSGHIYCTRSTDAGETWSPPAKVDDNASNVTIGWARIAVDTAGNLFCAWNEERTGRLRIWSSVSTDHGATWRSNVRVDDDTVPSDCYHSDVFVQPGTNAYLEASTAPYWVRPGYISSRSTLYRSTDGGLTFEPGVALDTFSSYCGQPHVVADAGHIICDYTGSGSGSSNQNVTEARTLYTQGDTWGPRIPVTDLDTLYSSYYNGAKLAIDAQGGVHTALMVCDLIQWEYEVYYTRSDDHGLTWAPREIVNDVATGTQADPNIAADSAGYAYVLWQDQRNSRDEIWFSTNNSVGIAEPGSSLNSPRLSLDASPNPFRRTLAIRVSSAPSVRIFDAAGRLVRTLPVPSLPSAVPTTVIWDGTDATGQRCAPGVYLLKVAQGDQSASAKVLLLGD